MESSIRRRSYPQECVPKRTGQSWIAQPQLRGSSSGGGRFAALLETFTAEHRTPLGRLERYRRFLAAVRAIRPGLYLGIRRTRGESECLSPFSLARLASFRFVFKLLVAKEKLFSGGENEIFAAVDAF